VPSTTPDDHLLAAELAAEAGRLLVEVRARLTSEGADPAALKAEGDRQAHEFLMAKLGTHRPDDAVLSEEATSSEQAELASRRRSTRRVWIVDPLDGTREYSEVPRSDWAVHVAMCIDGEPVVGAVALPALELTLSTAAPPEPPTDPHIPPRVVVSRSRPPAEALMIAEALGAELVEMGSAGAKAMAVVRGEVDVYPHSGGQYEWDSCAPVAVAMAAGLHCSRLDGSRLEYNRDDPYLPDLLICRHEFAATAIAAAGAD